MAVYVDNMYLYPMGEYKRGNRTYIEARERETYQRLHQKYGGRNMTSKPDIGIIDYAIRLIELDQVYHPCVALSHACVAFGGDYNGSHDDALSGTTYRDQYELLMKKKNGKMPYWWDNYNKKARLEALRKFRAACIEAGKAQ